MSRTDAVLALAGEKGPLVCGLTWLTRDLLGEIVDQSGAGDHAEALAAAAASLRVDLAFVDAERTRAVDAVEALHAADIAAIWCVDGVFGRVATAIGWIEALTMSAADPSALAARLDEALHDALVIVRHAFDAGADAVLVADDLSGPVGPLLSPDFTLDALVPCYHRLAQESAAGGVPALFHSDGEIRALMPALDRSGFSAVHLAGLDADAFALSAGAARRANLVVLGGVPASRLPEGARAAGERAATVSASLGGVIVCDDGGLMTFQQLTSFGVALEAARDVFKQVRG